MASLLALTPLEDAAASARWRAPTQPHCGGSGRNLVRLRRATRLLDDADGSRCRHLDAEQSRCPGQSGCRSPGRSVVSPAPGKNLVNSGPWGSHLELSTAANDSRACGVPSSSTPERPVGMAGHIIDTVAVTLSLRDTSSTQFLVHPPSPLPCDRSSFAKGAPLASLDTSPLFHRRDSQLAQGQDVLAPLVKVSYPLGLPSQPFRPQEFADEGEGREDAPAGSQPIACRRAQARDREPEPEDDKLEGRLWVLCWNIEHNKHRGDRRVAVAAMGRFMPSRSPQRFPSGSTYRATKSFTEWASQHGGGRPQEARPSPRSTFAPWAILQFPGRPQQTIGIASVYLPTRGRRSGAEQPNDVWTRVLHVVENDLQDMKALSS